MKGLLTRNRHWALAFALIAGILGVLLIARHWQHIGQHQWEPLVIPFTFTEGETLTGQFTAALSEPHEVEIEIDWSLPDEELDRLFYISSGPAPLDVEWKVEQDSMTISHGDCRDYLYLSEGGHYKKSKLKETILNIPFHRESSTGTISRGVGRFKAEAGTTYTVSAQVNASVKELNTTNPRFVARINRAFWTRALSETQLSAYSGLGFIGIAGAAFLWFLLGTLCQRNAASN